MRALRKIQKEKEAQQHQHPVLESSSEEDERVTQKPNLFDLVTPMQIPSR